MRSLIAFFVSVTLVLGAVNQTHPILNTTGEPLTGYQRATLLVYSQPEGGDLVWTGTTDGSLPALRLENGYIHNIDNILPGYVRDRGELWIEVVIDGHTATDGRMRYTSSIDRSLHRDTPADPGEVSETLVDELQIGLPGHELYVASATTGFGVDAPVEKVDIDGAVGLKGMTSLPSPTTDFGKVYVDDSDGHLYFMDEGGTSTDLLETTAASGGGTFLAAFDPQQIDVCPGQELKLGITFGGGSEPYTHLWTGDTSPLSATDVPAPVFSTTTPGNYDISYQITDDDGKTSYYMFRVVVHANPTPTIGSSPASGGCTGQPVTLTGDGCYEKYCWDMGPCSKSWEVYESSTYTLDVVDRWGCTGTATHAVTFLPPPVPNPGPNVGICAGSSDPTIGGSPAATGGVPPYFYEWSGTGISYLSSLSAANPLFDVSAAGVGVYNLTLKVTDSNGCEGTSSPITVTVRGLPSVTAGSNSPVCEGTDILLTASPSGGMGPYSFIWTGPASFTSTTQNPTITGATTANAGTYQVTVSDVYGCSGTPATTIVNILYGPTVTSHPVDDTVTVPDPSAFSVSATGDGTLAYQWQRSTNSGSTWSNVGTSSTSYTTPATSAGMDGDFYRCIVSGGCAPSDTSDYATLTVLTEVTWVQTSQTDFEAGIMVDVNGSVSPNDVVLDAVTDCTSPVNTWTFNNTSTGNTGTIQTWTASADGTYRIEVWGAEGGGRYGGLGARIRGDFDLPSGQGLKILVGQKGQDDSYNAGGGGGTFVTKSDNTPLIIAGGGGAATTSSAYQKHGRLTEGGGTTNCDTYCGTPGTGGNGGGAASYPYLGGAGGFYTNGEDNSYCTGGKSFLNGGTGGTGDHWGGFGGGGSSSASGWSRGGGGGGYSGGGSALHSSTSSLACGGGGSYNIGANQDGTSGARTSHGLATINQCGEAYSASGTISSQILDTTFPAANWNQLSWVESLPASTDIVFYVRASDAPFTADAASPSWTLIAGSSPITSGLPAGRYKQWRAVLETSDDSNTPTLSEVTVIYSY